jgi:hypothetical protein
MFTSGFCPLKLIHPDPIYCLLMVSGFYYKRTITRWAGDPGDNRQQYLPGAGEKNRRE